jgi:hypothetical protein
MSRVRISTGGLNWTLLVAGSSGYAPMMITTSKITSGEDHALRRGGASGTGKNRLSKYASDVRPEVLKEVCWGGSRGSVLDYEPFPSVNFGEDHVIRRGGALENLFFC